MSDNRYGTGLALRIRDWDDTVEEEGAPEDEAVRPFEGGVMLALATFFGAWDEHKPDAESIHPQIVAAVKGLRDTVEQVIE